MRNNPREIRNNFRMQPLIKVAYAEAEAHYTTASDLGGLQTSLLTDMALAYSEAGQWDKVVQLSTLVLDPLRAPSISEAQKSTAHYVFGTRQCELDEYAEALTLFEIALQSAESDSWLRSNIFRHIGLVHLKMQQFTDAISAFDAAFQIAEENVELHGAIPAIANYLDLCRAQDNLEREEPTNLLEFDETFELYQRLFCAKGIITEYEKLQSHDFISHQIDRAKITLAICEKSPSEDHHLDLMNAEYFLLQVTEALKANKADGVRLGDMYVQLGRIYALLIDNKMALKTYKEALEHYKTVLPLYDEKIINIKKDIRNITDKLSLQTYGITNRRRARTASIDFGAEEATNSTLVFTSEDTTTQMSNV